MYVLYERMLLKRYLEGVAMLRVYLHIWGKAGLLLFSKFDPNPSFARCLYRSCTGRQNHGLTPRHNYKKRAQTTFLLC